MTWLITGVIFNIEQAKYSRSLNNAGKDPGIRMRTEIFPEAEAEDWEGQADEKQEVI